MFECVMDANRAAPDVVYVLGPGVGEDLRYSLRSLRNVPHGRVWIFGATPPKWVAGVEHVFVPPHRDRYRSSTANLQAACESPEVSERFYLFNDDFYVMRPVETIPLMHRGSCEALIRRLHWADPAWAYGARRARDLCRQAGVEEPLSYELHVPMPVDKPAMRELLTGEPFVRIRSAGGWDAHNAHKRTLYGNLVAPDQERVQILDPKVHAQRASFDPAATYLSTSRWYSASPVARHITAVFDRPGPYEREYDEPRLAL